MKFFHYLFFFLIISSACAQKTMTPELPYKQIPEYPEQYTSGNVIARFIDGLGYRYYWATEGLREQDLAYKPSEKGKTTLETIQHIYDLSLTIVNVGEGKPNIRPYQTPEMTFEEYRKATLVNLQKGSELFRSKGDKDLDKANVIFKRGDKQSEFANWHLMNGQISDALYHTGQIVSFRRASGNPINSKVNVFTGKTSE